MAIKKSINKIRRNSRQTTMFLRRAEPNTFSTAYGTQPTTAGAVSQLSGIAQGDGLGDRTGDKIWVRYIEFGFNQLSSGTNNTRFLIVRDDSPEGGTPSVTDILTSAVVSSPFQSLNVTQMRRFRILFDKTTSSSQNGNLAHAMKPKKIMINQPTYFSGSAAGNKGRGTLYFLVITDVATSSNIDARFKLVYNDF